MSESLDYRSAPGHDDASSLPRQLLDFQKMSLVAGGIALGVLAVFGLFSGEHFFRSLLYAFDFWLAVSLGCLGFVMISHLTGGAWGAVIRRFGEAGFMNLPLMLLVFLVLSLGYKHLFPWGHMDDFFPTPEHLAKDPTLAVGYKVLERRAPLYSALPFFIRTLIYFFVWCFLAFSLRSGSIRLDRGPDLVLRRKMRKTSAMGMVLFFVTTTGYCLDYISGRETNWYSSILGFITAIGIGTAGVAFMSLCVCYFSDKKPLKDVLIPQHTNDLGNILLALTILWMYTTFAQFLIQWNGNMPEDTSYYTYRGIGRVRNGWQYIALLLLICNFFLPFFLLLQKPLKRNPATFARICILLLVMRLVHGLWIFAPNGPHRGSSGHIYLTDPIALVGVGGIWFFNFIRTLGRQRLLAHNIADEPLLLTHENSHGTAAQF